MQIITFSPSPSTEGLFNPPLLASSILPEWYVKCSAFTTGKFEVDSFSGQYNGTVKKCMPVLDEMLAGYIITLDSDIYVEQSVNNNRSNITWAYHNPHFPIIGTHQPAQLGGLYIPPEYSPHPYKWNNYWVIKTPPGHSCLFRHPFYHNTKEPFFSLPAMVDTDKHATNIHFPFLLKQGFWGIIPKGTPVIQIIPFMRQDWKMKVSSGVDTNAVKQWHEAAKEYVNKYKKHFRTTKRWM